MKFDPQKHHRRSIRLKGYDYTQPGAYFITMVTFHREHLFGEILNNEMRLSSMGKIADQHWRLIPEHFPGVTLGAHVIMPDHAHGILKIDDYCCRGTTMSCPDNNNFEQFQKPVAGSIPTIIRTYKASVTYRIQKELNCTGVWQRNYYEHVIRSEAEYNRIHFYIEGNVRNWGKDREDFLFK